MFRFNYGLITGNQRLQWWELIMVITRFDFLFVLVTKFTIKRG